jgi:hypothetical protein
VPCSASELITITPTTAGSPKHNHGPDRITPRYRLHVWARWNGVVSIAMAGRSEPPCSPAKQLPLALDLLHLQRRVFDLGTEGIL